VELRITNVGSRVGQAAQIDHEHYRTAKMATTATKIRLKRDLEKRLEHLCTCEVDCTEEPVVTFAEQMLHTEKNGSHHPCLL
jgi:NADP-dependent 3-hydroxy acid dehydrogenase YdfG